MDRHDNPRDTAALKWLWRRAGRWWPCCLALTALNALSALGAVALALVSRELIDSATSGNGIRLLSCAGLVLAVLLINVACSFLSALLSEYLTGRLRISLQQGLLQVLYQKSYANVTRFHSGELLNRMFSDVGVVVGGIAGLVPSVVYLAFKLVGAAAALTLLAPQLTLVFLAVGTLVFLVMTVLRGRLKALHKQAQEAEGAARSFLQEALESLLVTKVFQSEARVLDRAKRFQEKNFAVRMKRRLFSLLGGAGFGLIFQAGYALTMVWGCWQILNGLLSYGTLTAMLQLVGQIQSPFSGFSGLIAQYFSVVASAERLMELEALPDEAHREPEEAQAIQEDRARLYSGLRELVFDRVTFSYGRNPVLNDVSFRIRKGDFVSVSGLSGGGKSTMFYLFLGAYRPVAGRVVLAMDWQEKPELEPGQDVRKLFAYVPQGNYLFSGTVRENVTFFSPAMDDGAIWAALKTACADAFVYELPKGLETQLGEHGYGLSEGQMQRLAVARAILCAAPVLLLDEATSALDEDTEARLLANLAALKDRTCLIVTHRKAALAICNRHLVIDGSHVIEQDLDVMRD